MATIFFTSWTIYPILFVFGQEGFRLLSHPITNGLLGAADLVSKNLWGFMGWKLRRMLFRFIAEYGNPQTVKLAQEHRLDLTDLYYNDGQVGGGRGGFNFDNKWPGKLEQLSDFNSGNICNVRIIE